MTYQTSYPMSQPTQPQQPPRPRGNLLLGILLGVIVGAIIGVLAWFALIDDPDSATPAPAQSPTAVESVEPSPEASPDPSASPTEDPAEPEEPASPEPSPEPTEGDNPEIVTELPASWVTVLASLPKNSTSADQAIARAQEAHPVRPHHDRARQQRVRRPDAGLLGRGDPRLVERRRGAGRVHRHRPPAQGQQLLREADPGLT